MLRSTAWAEGRLDVGMVPGRRPATDGATRRPALVEPLRERRDVRGLRLPGAYAYASRRPLDEVSELPEEVREQRLLVALDHEPFLVVLDGMERILIAYANRDASHLRDDDLDTKAANMGRRGVRPPRPAPRSRSSASRT